MNSLLVKCFLAKFENKKTVVQPHLGFLIKGLLESTSVRPKFLLHRYALLFLAFP